MEREKGEIKGHGKAMISSSELVPRGIFSLCLREGEALITIYTGSFTETGGTFFANGEALRQIVLGRDIYYVFNPEDLKDKEVRKYIIPKSMKLDGLIG